MIAIPDSLIEALKKAKRVTALTGAGVSSESGVPTFRDAQTGLWASFNPMELATREAFENNSRRVWEWYAYRRDLLKQVEPNAGHHSLVKMEKRFSKFTLITQNVDGLHEKAGSRSLLQLHGNLSRNKCFEEDVLVDRWEAGDEIPPRCPRCGGRIRPDVVWFGEALPERELQEAMTAAQSAEVFLSIGTSGLVQPAASLPFLCLDAGGLLVEVNPEETPLTLKAHYFLKGPSGLVLPALMEKLSSF